MSLCAVKKVLSQTEDPFFSGPPPGRGIWGAFLRLCTYPRHLKSLRKKVTSRVALLKRLAGFWLGCWSNNVANSHPSPGPLNRRILRSCLVRQCSYPPHRPHQRRLANCDWMPASYTSGQPSNSRRHPTC